MRTRMMIPLISALLLTAACATNPVTGKRQLALITEAQEIQMGAAAMQDIERQMGFYPDAELQAYVNRIGQQLAATSERPELPWEFRVVDDPMVNAFAVPGGKIFVTRGILAHFNDEAELASVLGHEIGHVTARHSVEQMSKQQLASLGLGLAMILSPQVAQFGDLANLGLQLMFMKFGRDDERQSDDLGLRYMTAAGWDPDSMPPVFDVIGEISRTEKGGRVPEWASTHPDPENRAGRLREQIAAMGNPEGRTNEAAFMRQLDGMMFGMNPREGYTVGSTFIHPDLQFRMDFPQGWKIQNTKQAVVAASPQQDALVGLTLAQGSDARQAARAFFSQQGVQVGQEVQRNTYTFQAQTQGGGVVQGVTGFVPLGGRVFQVMGYTSPNAYNRYANTFASVSASLERETDPRYINVESKRIDIVEVPRDMSLAEFARNYPSTVDLQTLALANGVLREGDILRRGSLAKRIVGGRLPER